MHVRAAGIGATFTVMGVSLGGLRVRGPVALIVNSTHRVEFTGTHIHEHLPLPVRVAYCRKGEPTRSRLFEIGFAFLQADIKVTEARQKFLEHLISVFEFERSVEATEDREKPSTGHEEETA